MKEDEKRRLRKLKREVKREGNRNRRRALKRSLEKNPDEAQFDAYTFRLDASAVWNAPTQDKSRQVKKRRERDARSEKASSEEE